MAVYDIETFDNPKRVPYSNCIYRLSKSSGKINQDISEKEYDNCKKGCFVFKE